MLTRVGMGLGIATSAVCVAGVAAGNVALAELPGGGVGAEHLDLGDCVIAELLVEPALDGGLEAAHLGGIASGGAYRSNPSLRTMWSTLQSSFRHQRCMDVVVA